MLDQRKAVKKVLLSFVLVRCSSDRVQFSTGDTKFSNNETINWTHSEEREKWSFDGQFTQWIKQNVSDCIVLSRHRSMINKICTEQTSWQWKTLPNDCFTAHLPPIGIKLLCAFLFNRANSIERSTHKQNLLNRTNFFFNSQIETFQRSSSDFPMIQFNSKIDFSTRHW